MCEGEREEEEERGRAREKDRKREVDCLDVINLGVCVLRKSVECERGERRDSRREWKGQRERCLM